MQQPLLQVNNLSINFIADGNTSSAVKNSSFSVTKGEIVAIVGESGSGKSVTALSLMQLLPAQTKISGELLFFKEDKTPVDLLLLSQKEMNKFRGKDIAMIFQEPMVSLNPVLTCGYQVMEAIQLHQQVSRKTARQKTIDLFEKVDLPHPAEMVDRYPHQLSGGQKQRVMIAMAICCNPSLLIADEPTTALDVTVQKTILQLIKSLQQQSGMGVIFITHDLGLVADIADRIVVMYKGKILEQGLTKDVFKNPQHAYTRALLACRPSIHKKGERLPIVNDFYKEDSKEFSIKSAVILTTATPIISTIQPDKNSPFLKEKQTFEIEKINTNIALEVKDLKVYYPVKKTSIFGPAPAPFKAVDEISFNVNKGETIGLVGESGCGKTTVGRAILQLVPITAGNIILEGRDLATLSKKQLQISRKDLQIVFQDPYGSLNPRLMIGDAIIEPMMVHGIEKNNKARKEKVIDLLEKVNLSADLYNRYPHQFSGGQRQRICIARALSLNPRFLIFDESVSALDVSVQAQVLNLLGDLKTEFKFTSIFISHDLSVVRYCCDRILVMHKGKIIEEGIAEEIYESPKMEYTKKLIDAVPGKQIFSL